ncbi:hypothetical protein BDB00DRAFT_832125 [Zychaea mexicana]|uniref:uncharacterized protein n=1 Tax=Zychaea mexicana TaxID=64656 RepID=UPI0022FE9777|nr:uncharacterized protein BDB00DRAFT_832125 [Zychaea mexicana]KAI9491599.1 hypothetical protein BDB00DRAFT_832125 [Zychaea mexicana]
MARDSVEPSSSGSSISSQSDSESDSVDDQSSQQDILFSPHVSPSDLLQDDDPLFFIGLDFAQDETTKKQQLSLRQLSRKTTTPSSLDLPTPPASVDFSEEEYVQLGQDILKRHRHRSARTACSAAATKKLKVMPSDKMTPPASPGIEYFDDASAEESSDEEEDEDVDSQHDNSEQVVDPVFYSYHPQAVADFQSISAPDHGSDDNESTSSWEDIQQRADMFDDGFDTDSTSDEEEEAVLPPTPPAPSLPPKQLKQKRVVRDHHHHHQKQIRKKSGAAASFYGKQQASLQEKVQLQEQEHVHQHQQQQPSLLSQEDQEGLERTDCRATAHPTIYQKLTKQNVDWCRYCGTTEGVNWRPGPWGKRTLCNKHGCDYKGYGFACKLPRLDLTGFAHEAINDRDRPVLQLFCSVCHRQESWTGNVLVRCEGCPKAMHQKCAAAAANAASSQDGQQQQELTDEFVASDEQWFCDVSCHENARRKRIVVELPRKRLPLMCAPKNNASSSSSSSTASSTSSSTTCFTSSASSSLRSSSSSTPPPPLTTFS